MQNLRYARACRSSSGRYITSSLYLCVNNAKSILWIIKLFRGNCCLINLTQQIIWVISMITQFVSVIVLYTRKHNCSLYFCSIFKFAEHYIHVSNELFWQLGKFYHFCASNLICIFYCKNTLSVCHFLSKDPKTYFWKRIILITYSYNKFRYQFHIFNFSYLKMTRLYRGQ